MKHRARMLKACIAISVVVATLFSGCLSMDDSSYVPEPDCQIPDLISAENLSRENAVSESAFFQEMKDNWKVQLPVFRDETKTSVKEVGKDKEPLDGYFDQWFYFDPSDGAVVFYAPVKGAKTANTTYVRSELREMIGSSTADNWGWDGYHRLDVTEKVTRVPANGKTMVCQVHAVGKDGSNGPVPVKVIYQGNQNRIEVTFGIRAGASGTKAYYFDDVKLGQEFSTTIEYIDGFVYVTISSGSRSETFSHDFMSFDKAGWREYNNYFKAGNYVQDSTDPAEGASAVVRMYNLKTLHEDEAPVWNIGKFSLECDEMTLCVGERSRLSAVFTPAQTTDKSVIWSIEKGEGVAAVDESGTVVAISEGEAVLRAVSGADNSLSDSCIIKVKPYTDPEPECLYSEDFEHFDIYSTGLKFENSENGAISVVEDSGNSYLQIDDVRADAATKASYYLDEPYSGSLTLSARIKVDFIDVKSRGTSKPRPSAMYFDVMGFDEPGQKADVLGRMRNNSELASDIVDPNANRWGLTGGYIEAPLNAEQAVFSYGEWMDLTVISTSGDGSADSGTSTYYINGYKVGVQLDNKSSRALVAGVELYTGTKDLMRIGIDNLAIYKGKAVPESRNTTEPSSIEVKPFPSTMKAGESFLLSGYVTPASAFDEIEWSCVSGDSVAVTSDGYLIAVRPGSSTVRVFSTLEGSSVHKDIAIEVIASSDYVSPESISISKDGSPVEDSLILVPEKKYSFDVKVLPEEVSDRTVLFEVIRGDDVLEFAGDGTLHTLKSGTGRVRISSVSDPGIYRDISITVVKSFEDGTVVYRNGFDTPLDTNRWEFASLNAGNTSVKVEDGVLRIRDRNAAGQPKACLKFEPLTGEMTISFKLRIDDDAVYSDSRVSSMRIALGTGDMNRVSSEAFTLKNTATVTGGELTDRQFQYSLPDGADGRGRYERAGSYMTGEWYDVVVVSRTALAPDKPDTSDFYINGKLLACSKEHKVSYDVIDSLMFCSGTRDMVSYSVDDLTITTGGYDPEAPETPPAVLVVSEDFESGDVPSGVLKLWADGDQAVNAIVEEDSNHVLLLKDLSSRTTDPAGKGQCAKALYRFAPQDGQFAVSCDVKVLKDSFEGVKSGLNIVFGDSSIGDCSSSKNELFRLKLSGGKMKTRADKSSEEVGVESAGYQIGVWQTLLFAVNPAAGTFDLYVDGILKASGCPVSSSHEIKAIDHIFWGTNTDDMFEGLIDNVCVYQGDAATIILK